MIRLIDASSVQGVLDCVALRAAGIRGAYLKCTEGNSGGVDSSFATDVAAARAAGIAPGAYHFAYPLPPQNGNPSRSPIAQARAFFERSGGLGSRDGELPPAVDLEWPEPENWTDPKGRWVCTPSQIRDWGLEHLQEVTRLWGRKPLVYTYRYFWDHVLSATDDHGSAYADYPLWMADYNHYAGKTPPDGAAPYVPRPWPTWTLWQHDGNGGLRMPNGRDADFNVFRGDEDAWQKFLSIGTVYVEPAEAPMMKPKNDPRVA